MYKCHKCGDEYRRSTEFFYRKASTRDRLDVVCKKCRCATARERRSGSKRCEKCRQSFPGTSIYFEVEPNNKTGLDIFCRKCRELYPKKKKNLKKKRYITRRIVEQHDGYKDIRFERVEIE